jgi:hypothetical protein
VAPQVTWGLKQIEFPKRCVFWFLQYQMMDKVWKPSNSEYYIPLLEPFTIHSVSVIDNWINESFGLIVLLLVCECIKLLQSKSLITVSKKVMLNTLHVLLGLETVPFSTCRCMLKVNVLSRGPLSLFTNLCSTLGVLFELCSYNMLNVFVFAVLVTPLYSFFICFVLISVFLRSCKISSFVLAVIASLFIQGTFEELTIFLLTFGQAK